MSSKYQRMPVAIIRRPDGLYGRWAELGSRKCNPRARFTEETFADYKNHSEVTRSLEAAWERLAAVQKFDGQVAADVLRVLIFSRVPAVVEQKELSSLDDLLPQEPKGRWKKTAAHPRAYRGTKDRPAKSRQVEKRDLRQYLFHQKHVSYLLDKLTPCAVEVVKHLQADKICPLGEYAENLVSRGGLAREPAFAFMAEMKCGEGKKLQLPPLFCQDFLYSMLYFQKAKELQQLLAIYWTLDLERDDEVRAALAYLVSYLCSYDKDLGWVEKVACVERDHRVIFVWNLLRSELVDREPKLLPSEILADYEYLLDEKNYEKLQSCLCDALECDADAEFLKTGLQLYQLFCPKADFSYLLKNIVEKTSISFDLLRSYGFALAGCEKKESWSHDGALQIWRLAGFFVDFSEWAEKLLATDLPVNSIARLICLIDILRSRWSLDWINSDEVDDQWELLKNEWLPKIVSLLDVFPEEYHSRFLEENLPEILRYYESEESLSGQIGRMVEYSKLVCCPPFLKCSYVHRLVDELTELCDDEQWQRFLRAPEKSHIKLDRACRRRTTEWLVRRGFFIFIKTDCQRALTAFAQRPSEFIRTCKVLGSLGKHQRIQIIKEASALPLVKEMWPAERLREKVSARFIEELRQLTKEELRWFCAKKLVSFVTNEGFLTQGQLAGHLKKAWAKVPVFWCCYIEKRAHELLAKHYEVNDEKLAVDSGTLHALELASTLKTNKRGLRRFLQAHFSGDTQYLKNHPASQYWLSRHPQLKLKMWLKGIMTKCNHSTFGELTLSLESDPLEVLRMGTYVGSCFSLGGGYDYSAAATAMDINKQVIYARTKKGTVVARQALALSEKLKLVCFSVYPLGADKELKNAFSDYDRKFAKSLDLPLYLPDDEGDEDNENTYEIARIISSDWYDDLAWMPKAKASSSKRK